ncbi:hypothetical protein AMECASPLE_008870 [Ameca splendens]|uniref:Uncharacterized protein n=1 Tax=Ameca splendens TaxID=208324 RepID=A0ABV1A793_9TELE
MLNSWDEIGMKPFQNPKVNLHHPFQDVLPCWSCWYTQLCPGVTKQPFVAGFTAQVKAKGRVEVDVFIRPHVAQLHGLLTARQAFQQQQKSIFFCENGSLKLSQPFED